MPTSSGSEAGSITNITSGGGFSTSNGGFVTSSGGFVTSGGLSGTITSSGQYAPPCLSGNYAGAVIATLGALSSRADVYVSAGPRAQLSLSPLNPRLAAGSQTAFSAVATDNCGHSVSSSVVWSLLNGGGSVSSSGVFTAGTTPGVYADTLQASVGAQVARTPITVTAGPIASLTLTPDSATVGPRAQLSFSATARDAYGNVDRNET